MTLNFRLSQLPAEVQEKFRTECPPVLQRLARSMGVPDEGIERIVISDKENYAMAINELCPGERFTDGNGLVGVGKSLPRLLPTGLAVSDLVVRWEGVGALLIAVLHGKTPDTQDPDHQALAYVIPHEFGHCIDNFNRPAHIGYAKEITKRFKVQNWANVQSQIVIGEYAACVFSAGCVSEELLKHQFNSDTQSIGRLLNRVHANRRAYRDSSELYSLATDSCSTFWFAIIQASKLFGQREGSSALRTVQLDWETWFPESSAGNHLQRLEEALSAAWRSYPNCEAEFLRECTTTWSAIAEAEGFRFTEGTEGDGVFFETYAMRDGIRGFSPPARS